MPVGEKRGIGAKRYNDRLAWMGRIVAMLLLGALLLLPAAAQRPLPPPEEVPPRHPTKAELRKHNFEEMKKDAAAMVKAAEELREGVEKAGDLPLHLIEKKAAEIEKYSKRIQSKVKAVY